MLTIDNSSLGSTKIRWNSIFSIDQSQQQINFYRDYTKEQINYLLNAVIKRKTEEDIKKIVQQ